MTKKSESGESPQPSGSLSLQEKQEEAPLFFFSYAHAAELRNYSKKAQERNRLVIKFFGDLNESVSDLVSRPTGADPGYMDRSIPSGTRWTDELLQAIGTCQVFVALLSASYFTSVWCSKEWYAFSQRKVISSTNAQPDNQTAIVPVMWAPVRDDEIPAIINEVQRFTPDRMPNTKIMAQYQEHGVVGLLRSRRTNAYQGLVWQLAMHVNELRRSHQVESRTLRESDLCDIFREQAT